MSLQGTITSKVCVICDYLLLHILSATQQLSVDLVEEKEKYTQRPTLYISQASAPFQGGCRYCLSVLLQQTASCSLTPHMSSLWPLLPPAFTVMQYQLHPSKAQFWPPLPCTQTLAAQEQSTLLSFLSMGPQTAEQHPGLLPLYSCPAKLDPSLLCEHTLKFSTSAIGIYLNVSLLVILPVICQYHLLY